MERLGAIDGSQRNAYAFRGGLIALGGNTANGDQNIGLWIVRGSAPSRDRIGNDRKAGSLAHLTFKVTINIYDLTRLEIYCLHIERVEEEHSPAIKHTPIPVVESINRRIELIVAANRCQKKFVRLKVMFRDWANGQLRPA